MIFFFIYSRVHTTGTGTLSLKMAAIPLLRLRPSGTPEPRVLLQLPSSPGSSGEGSTSSCSPAWDTAWAWPTCGGSRTFVIATEEVSGLQAPSLPSEDSNALNACAYHTSVTICHTRLGKRPPSAVTLGVSCPPNRDGKLSTLGLELSTAAFSAGSRSPKPTANPKGFP